ncbi:unnamed protein product [Staurois parvus]|uniref:Uncharacterized protein n=1 Tax=Staurois parvus TaxID=386267 RepID=A0ABN9AEQ6_9NEOB|nr:unnamed protein product [Staurois parvus]
MSSGLRWWVPPGPRTRAECSAWRSPCRSATRSSRPGCTSSPPSTTRTSTRPDASAWTS